MEAPNAHLFLRPRLEEQQEVGLLIPVVDETTCTSCGKCAEVCQYHAIAALGQKTLVFPQLCHGCGSCTALCPEKAITEVPNRIGVIERGLAEADIAFARGVLDVGEPMAVPIIRQLKKWGCAQPGQVVIHDAPPRTHKLRAEKAGPPPCLPFGLHDLRLATHVAEELGIQAGVIINRQNGVFPDLEEFCADHQLPVLLRIPFERAIAEGVAQGKMLVEVHPEYIDRFHRMFMQIAHLL